MNNMGRIHDNRDTQKMVSTMSMTTNENDENMTMSMK
jgi:hypothetical protein